MRDKGTPKPFKTDVLDAAIARRRAKYEAQRLATVATVRQWLAARAEYYGIQTAYLFGSMIRPGGFTPDSDVDVAVEQINPARFFEAMGELSEQVEREVDLVELGKCPFAHRIREGGQVWMRAR